MSSVQCFWGSSVVLNAIMNMVTCYNRSRICCNSDLVVCRTCFNVLCCQCPFVLRYIQLLGSRLTCFLLVYKNIYLPVSLKQGMFAVKISGLCFDLMLFHWDGVTNGFLKKVVNPFTLSKKIEGFASLPSSKVNSSVIRCLQWFVVVVSCCWPCRVNLTSIMAWLSNPDENVKDIFLYVYVWLLGSFSNNQDDL